MPEETKETPMTTYYVETNNHFFRLNIPKAWAVDIEGGASGWLNLTVKEDGQLKYMIPYILSVRTTSISSQEAEAVLDDNNQLSGVSWVDVDAASVSTSTTAQRLRNVAIRRNSNGNAPSPSPFVTEQEYYGDEIPY